MFIFDIISVIVGCIAILIKYAAVPFICLALAVIFCSALMALAMRIKDYFTNKDTAHE